MKTARLTNTVAISLLVVLVLAGTLVAQSRPIDINQSKLVVHVSTAGLFSAFGDNHEVAAPVTEGFVDEAVRRVKLVVESQRLKVLDPQLSADKRRQVQERMLSPEVLDVEHFPRISFESTSVEQAGPGQLLVRGQLALHGKTHPVVVKVRSDGAHYVGTCKFKQREFGITPVSVAGGTVKVKDEVTIEFDIRTSSMAADMHPQ